MSAGDEIVIEYIELINSSPYPIHATEHLTGGFDAIPVSTINTDGLMSLTDKVKLNGIESSATGDMTSAEILTSIKNS